ncbi:MAG: cation diffusion facilitator family transporter [Methanothrix sp.]|uniref:cation diffusion facilitator family transporter n=1 Tax=Methanothrix sp. TaxID=90426 RepID=UPI0025F8711B|nr:cation diffusion facilitator family transporter [Methanothrix sp.]MCQ8903492.1 cation diffusion facilitator family transporter [Methanothrix sp.]
MRSRAEVKGRAARLSVIACSFLVALKLTVGLMIGSVSIISEAAHSAVDLIAALLAFLSVRIAGRPADDDHPFGHGKMENISGTVEALLIFLAAYWILSEAWSKILNPMEIETVWLGAGVMLVSAIVNALVSRRLFSAGRETESIALEADAWHLRTDVYTSLGVMLGLAAIWIGERISLDLRILDPLAAIFVSLLILKAALHLTINSARDLLDSSLPEDEKALIKEKIVSMKPEVRGFHAFRTRRSGSYRFAEFHILVDSDMTVEESHQLTDILKEAIREHYPCSFVTIHVEPCRLCCDPGCIEGCILSEEERRAINGCAGSMRAASTDL